MPDIAILADPVYKQHLTGGGHPERPERLDAVAAALTKAGLLRDAVRVTPRAARPAEILTRPTGPAHA